MRDTFPARWLSVSCALALIGFIGCAPRPSDAEMALVWRMLDCDECRAGELDSVVVMGERVVPTLRRYLNAGPPQSRRDDLERQLRARYQQLLAHAAAHPEVVLTVEDEDYVADYLDAFEQRVRERSAVALASIGGADAYDAVCAAIRGNTLGGSSDRIRALLDSASVAC